MKFKLLYLFILFFIMALCPGCAVVGDIFKAGVWVGILIVVVVVGVIVFAIGRSNK
jgi:hypothetical protein